MLAATTYAAYAVPSLARLEGRYASLFPGWAFRPAVAGTAKAVTRLGNRTPFGAATVGLVGAAWAANGAASSARTLALVGGATATTQTLQVLVRRPRDFGAGPGVVEHPSGHMTSAAALGAALVLAAPCRWRAAAKTASAAMSLGMATSLLLTWSHMPSDLVAGVLVAAIWERMVAVQPTLGDP